MDSVESCGIYIWLLIRQLPLNLLLVQSKAVNMIREPRSIASCIKNRNISHTRNWNDWICTNNCFQWCNYLKSGRNYKNKISILFAKTRPTSLEAILLKHYATKFNHQWVSVQMAVVNSGFICEYKKMYSFQQQREIFRLCNEHT